GLAEALAILQEFSRSADANRVDGDLSEKGIARANERAARVAQQKIADFERQRLSGNRELQARIGRAMSASAAPKRPTDPAERISYEMRQREIRDELRRLEPLQRLNVYLTTTD